MYGSDVARARAKQSAARLFFFYFTFSHVSELGASVGNKGPTFLIVVCPPAGEARRPDVDTEPNDMRDLAYSMVRVLDDDGAAVGPWVPEVDPDALYQGLRAMVMTRAYDDRMLTAQRQGKTSFYMRCTGEEAFAVGHALELHRDEHVLLPPIATRGG